MVPEPPIDDEVDLRDFQFMPLDVVRLWDSDLAGSDITGDEFRAAVLLWCKAWHQVPAGSLPDDDKQLARYAGFGRRDIDGWLEVREGALHGFEKCSDGRLYHPEICARAQAAWETKQKRRARTEDWGSKRQTVFERDNYTCQYCKSTDGPLHCDHIIPVSRGGTGDLSNLTTACEACNRSKGNKTPDEWRAVRDGAH